VRPLLTPALLEEWLPVTEEAQRWSNPAVPPSRACCMARMTGWWWWSGLLHSRPRQAMDYARQLKVQADALKDDLLIVMRVYFEKPRTTVGWKGYINDPYRDGSFAVNEGLELARRLLLDVLALGLPAGTNSGSAVAAVHQRPGQLGRDWRAHHGEPEPSPAGQRSELPRGLQERHRRRREGGQRCHFGRPVQPCLHGHDQDGPERHLRDTRQSGLPHHPARRQGPNYDAAHVQAACELLEKAACTRR
jgi:3-deoxy-7-phosphoheptulonate synthase